jgi:hypothetical protein
LAFTKPANGKAKGKETTIKPRPVNAITALAAIYVLNNLMIKPNNHEIKL